MIAYGVYPPTCFITKRAFLYLFMFDFTISSFITIYWYILDMRYPWELWWCIELHAGSAWWGQEWSPL